MSKETDHANQIKRRTFLKTTGLIAGSLTTCPLFGSPLSSSEYAFPVMDLHVHLSPQLSIDQVVEIAERQNMKFGILQHPGRRYGIGDDAGLKRYIDNLRQYPVYVGLQPVSPGWASRFSPEMLRQLDYVLMDSLNVPRKNGGYQRLWQPDVVVDDPQELMERYVKFSLKILNTEPIQVYGWASFLPVCIAQDYDKLWTPERMQKIIAAAKANNIALEINQTGRVPHEKFISMAKSQGLKFTFGSDSETAQDVGNLSYCLQIAKKCGLEKDDFFVPNTACTMK